MEKNKSKLSDCFFTLAFLLVATPAVVQAQTTTTPIIQLTASGCAGTTYPVKDGDRLYNMYGPGWDRLLENNVGLNDRITRSADGKTIAMLYQSKGDVLCIPPGMSVRQVITNAVTSPPPTPYPAGCTSAVGFSSVTGQACSGSTPAQFSAGCTSAAGFSSTTGLACTTPAIVTTQVTEWYRSDWFMIIVLLLAVAAVFAAIGWKNRQRRRVAATEAEAREQDTRALSAERERVLTQDPITSGTPFVPGGILPTETARLENFFDAQATNHYAQRNPGLDRNTVRAIRIGPIEAGSIAGEGEVGYLGGVWSPRRFREPIRGYRARYRLPDGTEEVLLCLAPCMNPVGSGYGEVYRGFTFTLGEIAVPALPETPVAPPQPAVPAAEVEVLPAIAPVSAEPTPVADGGVRFEILPANKEHAARIQMSGVDETGYNFCELKPGGVVLIRFTRRNGHGNGNAPDVIRQAPLEVLEQTPPAVSPGK